MSVKIFRYTKHGVLKVTLCKKGLELYQKYRWTVNKMGKNTINYYLARAKKTDGKRLYIYFQRELTNTIGNKTISVDHVNHDGLDNRLENLRICTFTENVGNTRKQKGRSSKYKGVSYSKNTKKYEAYISKKDKKIGLGLFTSEHAAAIAYNIEAKRYFGKFALLNKIGGKND